MTISDYINTGNYKKALTLIEDSIAKNPTNEKKLFEKATILYHLNRLDEAEEIFLNLYKTNSKSGYLLFSLALISFALNKKEKAFRLFELAYENGNNESIYSILKMLFERKGICDYANCSDSCCKNTLLKGIDGQRIKTQEAFDRLMANPNTNSGWQKKSENKKGEWIFECKHVDENNFCSKYSNRPQICKDFPSGILSLKKACSYYFVLKENTPKFTSAKTYAVIIDILKAYKYQKEIKIIEKRQFNTNN